MTSAVQHMWRASCCVLYAWTATGNAQCHSNMLLHLTAKLMQHAWLACLCHSNVMARSHSLACGNKSSFFF
jgi:hypothetical protein